MPPDFSFANLRRDLRKFLREWEAVSQELVDGIVLKRRSGVLYESFVKDTSEIHYKNPAIVLRNTARSAEGFGYAAFHEYYTGKAFIRPALIQMLNPARRYKSARALAKDAVVTWMGIMKAGGWMQTGGKRLEKHITIDLRRGRPFIVNVAQFQGAQSGLNLQGISGIESPLGEIPF